MYLLPPPSPLHTSDLERDHTSALLGAYDRKLFPSGTSCEEPRQSLISFRDGARSCGDEVSRKVATRIVLLKILSCVCVFVPTSEYSAQTKEQRTKGT